jgi:hypothetical protein
MNNWNPIETAPKDGTVILGYFPGFKKSVRETHWIESETREYGKITRSYAEWYTGAMTGFSSAPEPQPTHWMPIPEPPITG